MSHLTGFKRYCCLVFPWYLVVCQTGCDDLKARQLANDGIDALAACDFDKANDKFNQAASYRPQDADLQFASTVAKLFNALNSTSATRLRELLAIKMDNAWLFEKDGIFDRIRRKESLRSIQDSFLASAISCDQSWYQCIDEQASVAWVLFSLRRVLDDLSAITDDLIRVAETLEDAKEVEGLCELEPFFIHASDVYLIAAFIELASAIVIELEHYQWNITLVDSIRYLQDGTVTPTWIDHVNRAAFVPNSNELTQQDASQRTVTVTRHLLRSFNAFVLAFDSLDKCRQGADFNENHTLFGLGSVSKCMLDDLRVLAQQLVDGLARQTFVELQAFFPGGCVWNLQELLAHPPTRTTDQPLLSVAADGGVQCQCASLLASIAQSLSPAVFEVRGNGLSLVDGTEYRVCSGWRHVISDP